MDERYAWSTRSFGAAGSARLHVTTGPPYRSSPGRRRIPVICRDTIALNLEHAETARSLADVPDAVRANPCPGCIGTGAKARRISLGGYDPEACHGCRWRSGHDPDCVVMSAYEEATWD